MTHPEAVHLQGVLPSSDSRARETIPDSSLEPVDEKRPRAKRWDHRLSLESRSRCASTLKGSASMAPSTSISLSTGRPSPEYFPWESITIVGGNDNHLEEKNDIFSLTPMVCTRKGNAFDLSNALSYGNAGGSPQLLRFVMEHVELIHSPPYKDWQSCLTCGTTSAIEMIFRMFCERGDWLLTEAYTYAGAIEAASPLGINIMGVEMDDEGLVPADLESKLRGWDYEKGPKPFLVYMIPTGQNPTGTTQSLQRRKAIYQIAEHHDLYIIEDDPYYFVQLHGNIGETDTGKDLAIGVEEYVERLPTSYLSLDRSGRVIRLDSTSKILAPGLRCGWLTACSQVVDRFLQHTEFSTVSPSGPSQVLLYTLLCSKWGHRGFIIWLSHLSLQYRLRRNALLEACKHLPQKLCRWSTPQFGLFLWIRLDLAQVLTTRREILSKEEAPNRDEIENIVHEKARETGVEISKGSWFTTRTDQQDIFFRLTFVAAPMVSLDQAVARFASALYMVLGLV